MKISMRLKLAAWVPAFMALFLSSWSCSKGGYSGNVESINFGTVPTAATTLIYIAEDQYFFAANGLSVNIKDYNTGTATTEALLKGDLDFAWVAEFPKDEAQWMIKNNFTQKRVYPIL